MEELSLIRISTAGSVDDGKSTLIGRILYDTKSIFEDQYTALQRTSQHRGEKEVNLALLTDGLRAEREQGITIDVAYRYFATPKRRFIIADTPGHQQYTRNMVTGASTADAALILIDARNGLTEQSRRHAFIASLLRIPQVLVVVNKMDLMNYQESVFNEIRKSFLLYAEKLNLKSIQFIPISALVGDNVVEPSLKMSWYRGLPVLASLEELYPEARKRPHDFRLPISLVLRPDQHFRGFAGRVNSGSLRIGEELALLPSGQRAKVKKIFDLDGEVSEAQTGENVVITLDREVDLSRGDMVVRPRNLPTLSHRFEAVLCWMSEDRARTGRSYVLRHTTREVSATLEEIVYRFEVQTLHRSKDSALGLNDIGRAVISTGRPVFLDTYEHNRNTGSFLLIDPISNNVVAAGMVTRSAATESVEAQQHKSEVLWLTGLSGAGKSTIADALVERFRREGIQAARLDGDDLRTGLNSDLGFSPEARAENLRRAAHVAKLFAGLGNVTICSFITPLSSDREIVSTILGSQYVEVYVSTPLEECERRDPKGLYKKARTGQISEFTGITAPYEAPLNPHVVLDTTKLSVDEVVDEIVRFLAERRKS